MNKNASKASNPISSMTNHRCPYRISRRLVLRVPFTSQFARRPNHNDYVLFHASSHRIIRREQPEIKPPIITPVVPPKPSPVSPSIHVESERSTANRVISKSPSPQRIRVRTFFPSFLDRSIDLILCLVRLGSSQSS